MNIIREAATRVKGNWFQGGMFGPDGSRCGLGHISDVATEVAKSHESSEELFRNAGLLLREVSGEQFPERKGWRWNLQEGHVREYDFADFNDHPDTTEDEVIAVMEKAAVRLGEQL